MLSGIKDINLIQQINDLTLLQVQLVLKLLELIALHKLTVVCIVRTYN